MSLFLEKEAAQKRFNICKECEHLFVPTNTCKQCGCFMKAKVKFADSVCPIGKWGATLYPIDEQGDI